MYGALIWMVSYIIEANTILILAHVRRDLIKHKIQIECLFTNEF